MQSAIVDTDPDTLWRKVGSLGTCVCGRPRLESVEIRGEGSAATRVALGKGGGGQVERLRLMCKERRLYHYTVERSSMPVRDYMAEFRVEAITGCASRVSWSAQFELGPGGDDRTVALVRQFLHEGVENIKRNYSNP